MTELKQIQYFLADAFSQFVPLEERDDIAEQLRAIVSGNDRLSPAEQAEIYREQYWMRHRDCLSEDYPGLSYLIGEEAFDRFVRAYLQAHPPTSFTLRDLGNQMVTFADGYQDFPAELVDVIRAMVRFELAFIDIFDGPDAAPVTLETVEAIAQPDWPKARLTLKPNFKVLALDYPVFEIRLAVRRGEECPRALPKEPGLLAMWRSADLKVHYRRMDALEHEVLKALSAGSTLGEACNLASERSDDAERLASDLGTWFRGWALRGWIVDVAIQPSS